MPATGQDVWDQIIKRMRMNLTALQADVTELAKVRFPEQKAGLACTHCGVMRPTLQLMNDHLANVHGIEPKEAA